MKRLPVAVMAAGLVLLVAGCDGGAATTPDAEPVPAGPADPRQAVVDLLEALGGEDVARAVDLTVPGQGLAVAVAEQAPADELGAILDGGSRAVLANFWSSFATSVEELSGAGTADIDVGEAGDPFEVGDHRFAIVGMEVPGQAGPRSMIVREGRGWKVDVVATFAPGLATGIGQAPQELAGAEGGEPIIERMVAERPALEAALEDPALPPGVAQQIRSAVVALGGR